MSNIGLVKNYIADVAISPFRIVKQNAAADHVIPAAAATDLFIGVTLDVGPNAGERTDVQMTQIAFIEAGAAFAYGVPITSDAVGRAVQAAPAAGVNNTVIGRALEAASAAGDVVRVLLGISTIQG